MENKGLSAFGVLLIPDTKFQMISACAAAILTVSFFVLIFYKYLNIVDVPY